MAAGLRVPAAILIDAYAVLPVYYYEDARLTDSRAWHIAVTGQVPNASTSHKAHFFATAAMYRVVGRRPAVVGALAGILFAAALAFLARTLADAFGTGPALAFGMGSALWPSSLFYTSQNLKEPWVIALAYVALALFARAWRGRTRGLAVATGGLALVACGFLRSYVLTGLALAVGCAAAFDTVRRRRVTRAAALLLGVALASVVVYKAAADAVFSGPLKSRLEDRESLPSLVPITVEPGRTITLLSPEGIAEFRRIRQKRDQEFARIRQRREIGTQIYPDARFETWLDVALFVPKAAFHVLFMPLPGLYPVEGKAGRIVAAAENLILLALTLAAGWGLARHPPGRVGTLLLAFFAIMLIGTSPLEFDLGSASRHKLLYAPMLFPFAFGWEKYE